MPGEDGNWRPPHAYIPGQTARHQEDLFSFLKTDVIDCPVDELPSTSTWRYAEAFFNEGFYWEAHELLEAVWMACPPNSAEKIYVQARIQRSNAALKRIMGNERAYVKLDEEVQALMAECRRRSDRMLFGGNIAI